MVFKATTAPPPAIPGYREDAPFVKLNGSLTSSILPANRHPHALTRFLAYAGVSRVLVTAHISLRASSFCVCSREGMAGDPPC